MAKGLGSTYNKNDPCDIAIMSLKENHKYLFVAFICITFGLALTESVLISYPEYLSAQKGILIASTGFISLLADLYLYVMPF